MYTFTTHTKRMTFTLIVVLLLQVFVLCCNGQIDCHSPPEKSCAFYEECLEPKYQCGANGYPIGVGNKFCNIFKDSMDKFSKHGQVFLWKTMHCIQVSLVIPLIDNTTTIDCLTVEQMALDTHANCYVTNGFCDIPITDKIVLTEIVLKGGIADIFWDFVQQVLQILDSCIFLIF